jgi:hypothetical protein
MGNTSIPEPLPHFPLVISNLGMRFFLRG